MTPDQPTAQPAPIAWPKMNTPASPPAPPAPSEPEPLSNAQHALVRDAVNRRRIVKRAGTVARSSAVVMLIIGVTALMTTTFWPSWQSYLISVGLCIVGIVEYKGSSQLRRADIKAPRILGMNQLALLAIIVLYCAVQMVSFSNKDVKNSFISSEFRNQLSALPDTEKSIDKMIEYWAPLIVYGFYSLVIVLTGCFQGGMAGYYFGRKKYIEAYNRQTPQWIKRLLAEIDA
jgi:hypothetical protein